jgi:ubiquitin carboxyl-terminal hydrolase L5
LSLGPLLKPLQTDKFNNSPVYGVIFLFKYLSGQKASDKPEDGSFDHDAAELIFFAQQTIQNACGTQALLSILLNQQGSIQIGNPLSELKEFTMPFPAFLRGETLSNSELIRDVHNSFARSSPFINEAQRAATDDDELYHFIAYTPVNGVLYELDGLQPAPISHGECSLDEFPDKVIPVLQKRINRYPMGEIRFNLMGLVRDPRIGAREIGDQETVQAEESKRAAWAWENSLRSHNFIGFVNEILETVATDKLRVGEDEYKKWIEEAKEASKSKAKKGQEIDD